MANICNYFTFSLHNAMSIYNQSPDWGMWCRGLQMCFFSNSTHSNYKIVKDDRIWLAGPYIVGYGSWSVIIIATMVCSIACPVNISWISKFCTVWWHLILTRCQSLRRCQDGRKAPMPELGPGNPVTMTVQHCPTINLPTLFEMRTVRLQMLICSILTFTTGRPSRHRFYLMMKPRDGGRG
jgi:hypothetical protein